MANKTEYTNLRATDFVTRVSRYAESKVLYYSNEKIITFETYKKKKFVESSGDKVAVIPPGMEFRNVEGVDLGSLTSIPSSVEFKNGRNVDLSALIGDWFSDWKGNIEGIDPNRLLNIMISKGLFER